MARLVAWNYHQEDWNGKYDGRLEYMRLYDDHNNLIVDTGVRGIDGRNNYADGSIGGNFDSLKRVVMNWKRDLHSGGGGYWRLWVTDDLGNKYLALVSRFCKSGGNKHAYMDLDLGSGWDSGWAGFENNWRLRRVKVYNTNGCISVCNCNNGNCSCRGNNICNCRTGNCASYHCSCHTRCHSNCTTNRVYNCLCNNRHDAIGCSAHCASHTCNCNANKYFENNKMITISDINKLRSDINSAKNKFNSGDTIGMVGEEPIKKNDITTTNNTLISVYTKVKQLNPQFNYDYNDITTTLPTDADGLIKLATYRKMSNLANVINNLCTSYDTCSSNCAEHSTCTTRCTCNVQNDNIWKSDGYNCPCNSQCACNGQCSGVCVNCSCNAQDVLGGCYIV